MVGVWRVVGGRDGGGRGGGRRGQHLTGPELFL